jgi:alpha-methylacyl-CoA racemase
MFATRSRDEWVAELVPLDTCVAPVLTVAEIAEHPQFASRDLFVEVEGSTGRARQLGPVFAGSVRPVGRVQLPGPGTDTAEVLRDHGLRDDEVERLLEAGVIE